MPIKRVFNKAKIKEAVPTQNLDELEDQSLHAFLINRSIKNERWEILDFKNHLYLFDLYADFSPYQVIMKAAQVGVSTTMINKCLYLAGKKGMEIIYTLPSQNAVSRFVRGKFDRIVNINPAYKSWVQDIDNVQQKRIGNAIIYLQGTNTEQEALMITADLLICDEYDRSNIDVIEQYESRLQHSKYAWKWYLSNPSIVGYGVDTWWQKSDQKHWFIKCPHCSHWQYLSFPESISEKTSEGYFYICKKCKKELKFENIRKGYWVKKYKEREVSGYWIPSFLSPLMDANKIMNAYEKKDQSYFYNFVLGLPVKVDEDVITREIFNDLFTNKELPSDERVNLCMGVDVGIKKHYVIGNEKGIIECGETESWADIEYLIYKYNIQICVIDILPDITIPRELCKKYPQRVFVCSLKKQTDSFELIKWQSAGESDRVSVDRNRMIQLIVDELHQKKIYFWGAPQKFSRLVNHFTTMVKKVDNKNKVMPIIEWVSTTGQDHYVFATLFWRVALDRQINHSSAEIIYI